MRLAPIGIGIHRRDPVYALRSTQPTLFQCAPFISAGAFRGEPAGPSDARTHLRLKQRRRADRRGQGPMPYHRCTACGLTSYSAAAHAAASVCPTCSAPLNDATRLYLAPGATHTIKRALAARPDAAGEARREVKALPLAQEARDRVALVVSELVTNAVLHARCGGARSLVEEPARVVEHEVTGAYVRELATAMATTGPAGATP